MNGYDFLGKTRANIKRDLSKTHQNYTEFAHWLYLPMMGVILSFDKQTCRDVLVV